MTRFLLQFALLAAAAATAESRTWQGTVTHVSDGDTLWVRPSRGGRGIQVRLQGIDAPESCQPFGQQARKALRLQVLKQAVTVEQLGRDDYRRVLARVHRSGEDVGGWMVSRGLAWSYRFRGRPGPYEALQTQARQARRGLWSAASPMEPRVFRQWHGPCGARPPLQRGAGHAPAAGPAGMR